MTASTNLIPLFLLQSKAIKLEPAKPFTWASGWKSPIYCDNRVTLSFPDIRAAICASFVEKVKHHYPNVEVIAGAENVGAGASTAAAGAPQPASCTGSNAEGGTAARGGAEGSTGGNASAATGGAPHAESAGGGGAAGAGAAGSTAASMAAPQEKELVSLNVAPAPVIS